MKREAHVARRAVPALLVVVCAASLCCKPPPSAEELRLAAWRALPEPIRPFHAPDLELEGTWRASWIPERDSTRIEITELAAGALYRLWIARQPDQGFAFHFDVLADWRDGALWPRGTDAHTHGALYPARVEGRECLVPSDALARLGNAELWSSEEEHVFQRVPEARIPLLEDLVLQHVQSLDDFEASSVVEPLPAGLWELVDGDEWAWLEVTPTDLPAAFRVRFRRRTAGELIPANTFVRASFDARTLACEAPILGEARWQLALSGERAWLVAATAEFAQADANEEPAGLHFRLVSRTWRTPGPKFRGLLDFPGHPAEY